MTVTTPPPRRELNGVGQQIQDRLLQPRRIPRNGRQRLIVPVLDLDVLSLRDGSDRVDGRADDRRETDGLHLHPQLSGRDARDVEQVVDELHLRFGSTLDGLGGLAQPGLVQHPSTQHLGL